MLLGVSGAGIVTFSVIAMLIAMQRTVGFDSAVRTAVIGAQSPLLHALFVGFSWVGSIAVLGPATCVGVIWLWRRSAGNTSTAAALLSMSSVVITLALKAQYLRVRPPGAEAIPGLGYSFPSGHSLQTMAICVTVAYVSHREGLAPKWVIGGAILFSLLVGCSRVYLDVHWASDVIAGWSVGAAVAAACAMMYESSRAPAVRPAEGD